MTWTERMQFMVETGYEYFNDYFPLNDWIVSEEDIKVRLSSRPWVIFSPRTVQLVNTFFYLSGMTSRNFFRWLNANCQEKWVKCQANARFVPKKLVKYNYDHSTAVS